MAYRDAFRCEKCPQCNDPAAERACPAWWETVWTNALGEVKSERGCAFTQLPMYLNEIARQTAGAAVSAQQARDTALEQSRMVALVMHEGLKDAQSFHRVSDSRSAGGLPPAREDVRQRQAGAYLDRASDQLPGQRGNGYEADHATDDGPAVLRHDASETDLVEQYDLDLEGRHGR